MVLRLRGGWLEISNDYTTLTNIIFYPLSRKKSSIWSLDWGKNRLHLLEHPEKKEENNSVLWVYDVSLKLWQNIQWKRKKFIGGKKAKGSRKGKRKEEKWKKWIKFLNEKNNTPVPMYVYIQSQIGETLRNFFCIIPLHTKWTFWPHSAI